MAKETVQVVELLVPKCAHEFGVSPCTASGTPCYRARASCKDPVNFLRTYDSLFFTRGRVSEQHVEGAPGAIPTLISVSTSPSTVNLGGTERNLQGLGLRGSVTITIQDHEGSDALLDPYPESRGRVGKVEGSFWSRWLVINKYRQNIQVRIHEGYAGQSLSEMAYREYFLQSVNWPDGSGRVRLVAKDVLTRLIERKAQAPVLSPGGLYLGIGATATSFEVAGAVATNYPANGTLRIDRELMLYTGRSTSANGVTFTGVVRGRDGTAAVAHSAEALVQSCIRYSNVPAIDILRDLLINWGGIPAEYLDDWTAEFYQYLLPFNLTTVLTKPESVTTLISEILEQIGAFMWWDDRHSLVRFRAMRVIDQIPPVFTEEYQILPGLSIEERPDLRLSRVWFNHSMRDFTGGKDDEQNFERARERIEPIAETAELYGEKSIRKIYSRWIRDATLASYTGARLLRRYVDTPRRVRFRVPKSLGDLWTGDVFRLSHSKDCRSDGVRQERIWTIISADEVVAGEEVEYVAEDTTLWGQVNLIMSAGSPDFDGALDFGDSYITDQNGFLSDGVTPGARIS